MDSFGSYIFLSRFTFKSYFFINKTKGKAFLQIFNGPQVYSMTKTNINLKPLKIAFSAHIGSFLDALNTPFYPYYKIYLREIFNYNIFFKVLQFVGISHQNYYRTFGRKRKKIFIRTIFWVVIGPCGSIYDQSKCRNLNTESVYV